MAKRLTVVVSQGQTQHPAKRALEENLVTALILEAGIEVVVIPHLYDLKADGTGVLALQKLPGPIVVVSWLFDRAARWVLDRYGVHGREGICLLRDESADDTDADDEELATAQAEASSGDRATSGDTAADAADVADEKARVLDARAIPDRRIYCLDLRLRSTLEPFLAEILRIRDELNTQVVELLGPLTSITSAVSPVAAISAVVSSAAAASSVAASSVVATGTADTAAAASSNLVRISEETDRRWYPVIDFSRCTNCMECIDFCLFGVYGVDRFETILVEQPDNCRKGCPACSRVCPENAIIFPQHKSPAIAGSAAESAGSLKIDLSKLFGAPDGSEDALSVAARERDEQLMLAGRQAVGTAIGMPQRQANKATEPKDKLDHLIDALDELDL
ncbi:MAG: ATP-binding protein [Planctomycetota bacterium]